MKTILVYDRAGDTGKAVADMLKGLHPGDKIHGFDDPDDMLSFANGHIYQVVFLRSDGSEEELAMAKALTAMIPGVNLIFVSADRLLMEEAIRIHASGYICLPLTEEKLESELGNLLYPVQSELPVISVRGEPSEVYIDGRPVHFAYRKTSELLVLLLQMKGAMLRTERMSDYLWEEDKPVEKSRSYLQNLRSDLIHTLSMYGLDGAVCHRRGKMWLDRDMFVEDMESETGRKQRI